MRAGVRRACQAAILALFLVAAGKLGLLLSVPPSYETIIWPPAGIAIGALLVFGFRLWPGVFASAFILQLWGAHFLSHEPLAQYPVALLTAAGATAQAVVAYALVARFQGVPLAIRTFGDGVRLLLLAGPLACIISPAIAVLVLWIAGPGDAALSMVGALNWYGANLFGVTVFLPLMLILPRRLSRLRWPESESGALPLASLLILLLPLELTFFAWKETSQYIYERSLAQFASLAEENEAALLHRMGSYEQALKGAVGFFKGSDLVTRQDLHIYVEAIDLQKNSPGIAGIGYVANVASGDRAAFESVQREDLPHFAVHPPGGTGASYVIQYIEPIEENRQALGLDIASEARRREAAERARDTGEPAITRPITLVQDRSKGSGFLLLDPIYRGSAIPATVEARRDMLQGWVYAPFVAEGFMDSLTASQGEQLNLRVFDGTGESPSSMIYQSADGDEQRGMFTTRRETEMMQRPWTLVWTSTPAFDRATVSQEPLLILLGGLAFTGLFGILLLFFSRRADTVSALVNEKTKEIAASEEQLKLLIRHTPAAVAMFDRDMHYILASERWAESYHLDQRDIVGESHYSVFPQNLNMPKWLAAQERALRGEDFSDEESSWISTSGRPEWVKWAIHPWIDAAGKIGGIVMFTESITDRKRAEERTQVLREIAVEAVDAASVEIIYRRAIEKLCGYLSWHVGRVCVWSEDLQDLTCSSIWHISRDSRSRDALDGLERESSEPGTLARRVREERRSVMIADLAAEEGPALPGAPALHLHAAVGIPVFVDKEIAAVLEVYSERFADLTTDDLEFFELLVVQMSRAVERRTFENALAKSNQLNNAVLNSADYMVIATQRDGKVLVFNEAAERKSGYAASEVVGNLTPMVWHDEKEVARRAADLNEEHGDNVDVGFGVFTREASRGRAESREWTFIRKDGTSFPVNMTVTPLSDEDGEIVGFVSILEDITLRRQQDAALRASEEAFRSAMESASSGMALVDINGRFLKVNPAICELFGYTDAELSQMNLKEISHPAELEKWLTSAREVLKGKQPSFQTEKRYIHKSGRIVWVLANISLAYDADGNPKWFIAQVQDITERREMERMKSEFVSVVSHELRTPLTSIRGSLGLIAGTMSQSLPGKVNQLIGIAHSNCERLILLINDILDMDKIATGNMRFNLQQENLRAILREAVEGIRPYGDRFGVNFELHADEDITVHVDPSRLTQVMANLLSNAAKFSPEDGQVVVRIERRDGIARVTVRDYGTGIPVEFQDRIFGRFSQADSSVTRAKGGNGLGLHISKQLIEQMDGKIGFHSIEGEGTEFWIELPDCAAEDQSEIDTPSQPLREVLTQATDSHRESGARGLPRILHVEDDTDFTAVLETGLSGKATIISAPTLKSARRYLSKDRFDLIVLDCGLPDGNGMSLLELLTGNDTPLIFLSAHEVTVQRVAACLVKSRVSESKIIDTILEVIAKSEDAQERRLAS